MASLSSKGQDFILIKGKILTEDTKERIPFASIGIPEKGIGNISNETGDFELKIPAAAKDARVCISALGFKEICQPVSGFKGKNNTIFLEPANLQLATVEVKALSAENLVKEAIKRIPENYASKPVKYTYYQRQASIINDKPVYLIESVSEAYRNFLKDNHQLSLKKSRGMATSPENQKRMDNVWVAVFSILAYDNIHTYPDYLHPSKSKNFNYKLVDEKLIGPDTVYVIAFNPKSKKNGNEAPGTEGKLYLHNRSYAIIRLERQDNKAELARENASIGSKAVNKACKCTSTYLGNFAQISYKRIGKRWYFSHANSQGLNHTAGESYPVPENSQTLTQLVVTNIAVENAPEIPEAERVKPFRNHYSKAPKDMNEAYWEQYNVLPLPDAYQKLLTK